MPPVTGDIQNVDLDCPVARKKIAMTRKYCQIFDTKNDGLQYDWVNDLCLNRDECRRNGVPCRYSAKCRPGLPNPFKDPEA